MKHLSQDELALHYYGESGGGVAKHIGECLECRAEFEQLSRTLSAIVLPEAPSRGDNFGSMVWSRIRHKLPERTKGMPRWEVSRRWAVVATVAILVAVAFFAGRYTNRPTANPPRPPFEATHNPQLPQKVLVVALDDYLDRSEMLLVEVAHAKRPEDLDLNTQRRYASELIATNRLYRQTAQHVGDAGSEALLDQLERVLLQLAHTPRGATSADIQPLRQEIESGGLLFRVRVAQMHIESQAKPGSRARTGDRPSSPQDQRPIL